MKKIKAYVDWNDSTKTHYYTNFEVIENLPKINEVYYEDSGRIETVKSIESVELDCEQGNEEVYNYDFYKVIVSCYDKDYDENDDDNEYYVCIEKEDN